MRFILIFALVSFSFRMFAQPGFIENKGQWHPNALYKTELPGGSLFLEKDGLTYNFVDSKDVQRSHANPNSSAVLINSNRIVHLHSYKVKFGHTLKGGIEALGVHKDYTNYFIGKDSKKWTSKVLEYDAISYNNLYQNIDFKIYVNSDKSIQYDFIVNPGGNPDDIRLTYEGQDALYVDTDGSLTVKTSLNKVTELKPFSYQEINGKQIKVPCTFLVRDGNVAFQFPQDYNHDYPLIIDPVLVFSTYSGSTSDNWGLTATFDDQSNVFSGGVCFNVGYPVSVGAYQINFNGGEPDPNNSTLYQYGSDIAIIKYDATGTQRLWATYLGGTLSEELSHSLVCNRNNDLVIFGTTGSADFPTTTNAYDNSFNGGIPLVYDNVIVFGNGLDIFVSKLSSDGTQLLGSTYVGGSGNDGFNFRPNYTNYLMQGNDSLYFNYADGARGEVICDQGGDIYVGTCTFSSNFPVTSGSFGQVYSGKQEGVVFKLNSDLSQLVWSSYFGGSNDDAIYSLDLDNDQEVYIGGGTNSVNIPTTGGVYHPLALGGSADGFIAHISSDGSTLIKSTYFGSSLYDQVYFVRVDKLRNIYVTGQTKAPGNTFIYNATYGTPGSGQFIAKFPNDLSSPIWSTAFGTGNLYPGRPNISITAFSVDYCNRIYLAGWGREWAEWVAGYTWANIQGTKNMDITPNAYQTVTDGQDFYLMVMADDASHLEYGTYFGEQHGTGICGHDHVDGGTSRFDKRGYIYESVCASCNGCNTFPTFPNPGAWSNTNGNAGTNCNNAVFKFSFELPLTIADFLGGPVCAGDTIHFTNTSQLATDYYWDFGDATSSTDFAPAHVYTNPGSYNVTLIASHPTSCNLADTIIRSVVVEQLNMSVHDTSICAGNIVNINANVTGSSGVITYVWSHYSNFSDVINSNPSSNNINVNPAQTTTFYVHVSNSLCDVIDSIKVNVYPVNIATSQDTAICVGSTVQIHAYNQVPGDTLTYEWWPASGIINGQYTSGPQINPGQNTIYYVSVTNQHGCTSTDSVRVDVDLFTLNAGPVQNVQCYGFCNGSLSVYANNGYNPYTFHWSNNDTTSSVGNLCPNNYSVTVTDGIGCNHILNFNITEPPLLIASIASLTAASCDLTHPNTGSAVVTPSGGTPGYTYYWNNSLNDSLILNLYSGHYIVTVTDAHGCDTILSTDIVDQSNLAVQTAAQSTLCYGYCDGSAQVSISTPGVPPYTYHWNTGSDTTFINNLCSNYYWVTVTDSEYCVRVQGVYVYQPDSIFSKVTIPGIACYGGNTSATASVENGGTPPYTYHWSTGYSGNPVTGLTPGNYWLYVTDFHGCPDTLSFAITQPAIITHDTTITPVACAVACNGTILLPVWGGTLPYTFNWSNGSHSSSLQNLCPGNYNVTVTDHNGCSFTDQFNVEISDYLPSVDATTNTPVIYLGQSAHLFAVSNSNYTFTWLPAGTLNGIHLQNPTATPDEATTYQVIIEDSWGCTNTDSVTINVMDVNCNDPYIYVPNAFTPNGDGKNDILYVKADIASELYFAIYDRWGETVFSTTSVSQGWNGTYKGKPLDPAVFVYYLKVTCINKLQFEKKGNITLIR